MGKQRSPLVSLPGSGCRRDCDEVLGTLDQFKVVIDAMMTLLERCKEAGDGGPVGRGESFWCKQQASVVCVAVHRELAKETNEA